jgi:hypothetical protein
MGAAFLIKQFAANLFLQSCIQIPPGSKPLPSIHLVVQQACESAVMLYKA